MFFFHKKLSLVINRDLNKCTFFVDANCESDPDCPGKCRASCLAGEVVSSVSGENNGCKNSPVAGFVDYCCRVKGQLTSTDIAFASSSTNLPIHPAANAVDGSLSTEWQPIPNAALPQWVQVINGYLVELIN